MKTKETEFVEFRLWNKRRLPPDLIQIEEQPLVNFWSDAALMNLH